MIYALRTLVKLNSPWDEQQKTQVLAWLDCAEEFGENIDELSKENEQLKAQIEKMKCCCNCDWSKYLPNGNCLDCGKKLKNWKLKED